MRNRWPSWHTTAENRNLYWEFFANFFFSCSIAYAKHPLGPSGDRGWQSTLGAPEGFACPLFGLVRLAGELHGWPFLYSRRVDIANAVAFPRRLKKLQSQHYGRERFVPDVKAASTAEPPPQADLMAGLLLERDDWAGAEDAVGMFRTADRLCDIRPDSWRS